MEYFHGKSLIKIALADDHTLFRESLCSLINNWENCKVILQAANGKLLIEQIDPNNLPDLVLTDLCMPELNGYETIKAIKLTYPEMKFLVLSKYECEETIMRILKSGAQGFINKKAESKQLKKAIFEMMLTGFSFANQAAARLVKQIMQHKDLQLRNDLSDKELAFLKHIATEMTYNQIAQDMAIPVRQVEYLRKTMFDRFEVQSRTSLAVQSLEKGLTF